ncbi:hypothetical protein [Polyangium spumosum]|uniref:Uncharacterized protein n=1 Tax=Polyangium spumosum TaxID=889282 RepID=A0A6N7PUV0_9BACT|nr:hypothetical protein [Polyangium spumosum]MRG94200.1 hypothetical protein [Polyangium spumosum]
MPTDEDHLCSDLLNIAYRIAYAIRDPHAEHDIRVSGYNGEVGDGRLLAKNCVLFSDNAYRVCLRCKPDKFTLAVHVEVLATRMDGNAFQFECLGAVLLPNGDKDAFVLKASQAVFKHMEEWRLGIR